MKYFIFVIVLYSLSGCCFGIKCGPCDPEYPSINVVFDTSGTDGFKQNELDPLYLIRMDADSAIDTSIIEKMGLGNYTYSLSIIPEHLPYSKSFFTYKIVQKDSLFIKQLSNFSIRQIDGSGCCACVSYALNSFELDGNIVLDDHIVIRK